MAAQGAARGVGAGLGGRALPAAPGLAHAGGGAGPLRAARAAAAAGGGLRAHAELLPRAAGLCAPPPWRTSAAMLCLVAGGRTSPVYHAQRGLGH